MRLRKLCVLFGFIALLSVPNLILAQNIKEKASFVVGGQPADPGEYPFMVALMNPNNSDGYTSHYCGGALIHPEWVLTAAHCLAGESSIDVGLGIHDLSASEGERILVSDIIPHPNYDTFTSDNDIALLKLSSPANGYQLAQYAMSEAQNAAGTNTIAIGWGALSQGGNYPTILYEVDVPLVTNSDCNAWGQNGSVTDNMLCAGYIEGGRDTCQGDSGGPLFYYDGGTPVLVGATSWGDGCAAPNFPGVYARVSYFADWITSYIGDPNITPTPTNTPDSNATPTPIPTATFTPTPTLAPETDAYENDNDANSASAIANGETQAHSILPAGDEDWLTFTLDTPSSITLETSGLSGDTYLFLYDGAGNEIDSDDDDGGGRFSFLERSCATNPLPAGTYTVMIREYSSDSTIGNYDVSFNAVACTTIPEPTELPSDPVEDEYEVDNTADSATMITDSEVQTHSILPVGDQDWLTFTLADESAVSILTSGNSGDTRLYLYDGANNEIDFDDDIEPSVNLFSQIERTCDAIPLPAGTYTILVDEYGNDNIIDRYDIRLDVTSCSGDAVTETPTPDTATDTPEPPTPTFTPTPDIATATDTPESEIPVDAYEGDETVDEAALIIDGEPQIHTIFPAGDRDWLAFTITEESSVSLATATDTGVLDVWMYNGNMSDGSLPVIAGFGEASEVMLACDVDALPAGTYYVQIASDINDPNVGEYDVTLDTEPCGNVPLAVTLNNSRTGVNMSGWTLWGTVFVVQAGLVALILRQQNRRTD